MGRSTDDLWKALTMTALRLLSQHDEKRAPLDVDAIVDATLAQYPSAHDHELHRTRLRDYIRDMAGRARRNSDS